MIWIKIIGSVLLVAASSGTAVSAIFFERRRLAVLDGFIRLISYVRGCVDLCAMPINDILSGADDHLLEICGGCGLGLAEMVENCRPMLNPESSEILSEFSAGFGKLRREAQIKVCDGYIARLSAERGKIAGQLASRVKVISTVSLCLSAAAALILW